MTTTKNWTAGQEMALLKRNGQGSVPTSATRREQLMDECERNVFSISGRLGGSNRIKDLMV